MTDRENTIEDALPQSEAFNRTVVESSRDCLKILSLDGRLLWMNEEGQRMLCIADFAAVVGKSWIDFWAAEDRVAATKAIAAAIRGGSGSFSAMYIVAGEERWFDVLISPIRGRDGNPHRLLASSRDITLRKRLEDSLRRSEERSQIVGHATNDAVWDWDLQTNSVWWNQGVTSLFGYQSNQVAPDISWWYERVHPDDCARIRASVDKAIEGTEVGWRGEYRFRREDGSYADVFDRGYIMRGHGRKAVRIIGAMQDTSERKRAEDALRESERRFRSFVEATAHVIWRTDAHGAVDTWLKEWCAFTGQSEEEARGFGWMNAIHRDDRPKVAGAWENASKTRATYEVEYRLKIHTGQWRDILARGVPVLDDEGEVLEYIGTCIDITEQKKAESALRRSEEQYRELFSSIDEGFCVIEMLFDGQNRPIDYRFIEVNPAFTRQTGLPDAVGKTVREMVPQHEQHWFDIYGGIVTTGTPVRFEQHAAALGRWYDVYAFRLGHSQRVGVLFHDVTVRKRAEQAIRESEQGLEQLVAERTAALRETVGELEAFSYTIAHDMRAPLRAMQSFADILTHDYAHELTVEAQGLLGRIATSANRLDNLIQDVLNYSKVVRANLTLQRVNTRVLLAEIIDTYPNLQRNTAHIALPDSLPDVIGNRAALTQVFSNLLGNAVKFVPPGSAPRITIRAEPAPTSVQNGNPRTDNCNTRCVRLWFEDNGIGIAPQEIPKLFHMFHRAHAPGSYEGTGVGLAIVRKAVERMSGRVGVESELGKGSKFWIELPSGYN